MLKFGNKEFRNLQEQVFKNMKDIAIIKSSGLVLDEFGIKVVGQESSVANMPTVADYKLTNPDWAYGDAYAIGTEAPYTLYILTREDANHTDDYWFNIGRFPEPGPQGPQGPQGEIGPQGQTGNPGTDGAAAGFGSVTATAITLEPDEEATVSVVTSGPNTEKSFAFTFGIPKGEDGTGGGSTDAIWGNITGDLSNQTDLVNALQSKQNLLVSGTNIKTISGNSILGSGDVKVSQLQATATIVIDALTNLNGRIISNYEATLDTSTSYTYYVITRGGNQLTEEQARDYMEYMTGSRFLPVYDYETPENSIFIFANGSLWKPQFDNVGLKLFALPNPYASKVDLNGKQNTLISGINIKTINDQSLLGAGNIDIRAGNTYTGIGNVTINSNNQINTVTNPTFENIIVDNGTSGLYVNSLGDVGLQYVDNTNSADIRIIQGVPELQNTSTDYQAYLRVGTQGIDITKKDLINDTTVTKDLFTIASLAESAVQPATLTNYVDLTSAQTISGAKTFTTAVVLKNNVGVKYGNSYSNGFTICNDGSGGLLFKNNSNVSKYHFTDRYFYPDVSGAGSLGTSSKGWGDLYLTGAINKNASTFGLTLPDTSSLTANDELVDTVSDQTITGAKTFGSKILPATNNTLDLGNSSKKWQHLYLGGSVIWGNSYIQQQGTSIVINPSGNSVVSNTDNTKDLGASSRRWRNLYLSGNLSDGTNTVSVAQIASGLGGTYRHVIYIEGATADITIAVNLNSATPITTQAALAAINNNVKYGTATLDEQGSYKVVTIDSVAPAGSITYLDDTGQHTLNIVRVYQDDVNQI